MTPPLNGPSGPTGPGMPGLLTPAIRRDVADLNRQYLGLAIEPALRVDPRVALPDDVHEPLSSGDEALRVRVASCPFTLFEVSLGQGLPGGYERGPGVEDARRPLVDAATVARMHSFASVAMFLAWRLADGEPLAFRLVFGLPPGDELRLNQARPTELPQLAGAPRLIRPRWLHHPRFWRLLLRAAAAGSDATLQRVHCAGICMVIADLQCRERGPPQPDARGRR